MKVNSINFYSRTRRAPNTWDKFYRFGENYLLFLDLHIPNCEIFHGAGFLRNVIKLNFYPENVAERSDSTLWRNTQVLRLLSFFKAPVQMLKFSIIRFWSSARE